MSLLRISRASAPGGAIDAGGPSMSETEAIAESGVAPGRSASAPFAQPSIRLLGLDFYARSPAKVLRLVAARPVGAPFAYVVMPNAHHLIRLARDPGT